MELNQAQICDVMEWNIDQKNKGNNRVSPQKHKISAKATNKIITADVAEHFDRKLKDIKDDKEHRYYIKSTISSLIYESIKDKYPNHQASTATDGAFIARN